jgi:hypothetical protein
MARLARLLTMRAMQIHSIDRSIKIIYPMWVHLFGLIPFNTTLPPSRCFSSSVGILQSFHVAFSIIFHSTPTPQGCVVLPFDNRCCAGQFNPVEVTNASRGSCVELGAAQSV